LRFPVFVSWPCARLSWPSPFERTLIYRIVSYPSLPGSTLARLSSRNICDGDLQSYLPTPALSGVNKSRLPLTARSLNAVRLACTVLYTDVHVQRDKLVTDDRHQFITPTVHL